MIISSAAVFSITAMNAPAFQAFGTTHQSVLVMTVIAVLMLATLRRARPVMALLLERLLGTALFLTWPASAYAHWLAGDLHLENALPCHFCDIAAISGSIALWTHHRLACEVLYFFGMAGTLQGLLTPNLQADFPDARFVVFFMVHAGVVVAALHVVTAMHCPPRAGAVKRMFAFTMLYAVSAGAVNALLGTNFGFLCQKPEAASLMDKLGPWPWYIASLIALCVIFYTVLNLPFVIARAQGRRPK
jgi:hypothetical integral membrane protein (TIGR02206 family)